jgi:hypothetical protein
MAVVVAVVNRRYRLTVTGCGFVPIPGAWPDTVIVASYNKKYVIQVVLELYHFSPHATRDLRPGLFIFFFFWFSGIFPKLRAEQIQKITVTWHFPLVQRRVKIAQTLSVKGTTIKLSDFNSEVVN